MEDRQHKVESMYLAITRPKPPPFLSFDATVPETAEATFSAAMRSSASRLPGIGASTVTRTAFTPSFFADRSRVSVFSRSLFTYSCRKKGCPARPAATMSDSGYDALLDIYKKHQPEVFVRMGSRFTVWMMPWAPQPRAKANSPSGCARRAMAAGLTKNGAEESQPRIFRLMLTSLTFRRMRGRKSMLLWHCRLARCDTRSVAAEE